MKKYSARRVGLGARNLFRSGGGRTEVRAPDGLRRCRSEATVPYRRLGVSKSTVDSHFRGNRPFVLVVVLVLVLDRVVWLRGGGRRARGRSGSWSQCAVKKPSGLSLFMNRPTPDPSQEGSGHWSASCQFPSWEALGVDSWSTCMRKNETGLSMNGPLSLPSPPLKAGERWPKAGRGGPFMGSYQEKRDQSTRPFWRMAI